MKCMSIFLGTKHQCLAQADIIMCSGKVAKLNGESLHFIYILVVLVDVEKASKRFHHHFVRIKQPFIPSYMMPFRLYHILIPIIGTNKLQLDSHHIFQDLLPNDSYISVDYDSSTCFYSIKIWTAFYSFLCDEYFRLNIWHIPLNILHCNFFFKLFATKQLACSI